MCLFLTRISVHSNSFLSRAQMSSRPTAVAAATAGAELPRSQSSIVRHGGSAPYARAGRSVHLCSSPNEVKEADASAALAGAVVAECHGCYGEGSVTLTGDKRQVCRTCNGHGLFYQVKCETCERLVLWEDSVPKNICKGDYGGFRDCSAYVREVCFDCYEIKMDMCVIKAGKQTKQEATAEHDVAYADAVMYTKLKQPPTVIAKSKSISVECHGCSMWGFDYEQRYLGGCLVCHSTNRIESRACRLCTTIIMHRTPSLAESGLPLRERAKGLEYEPGRDVCFACLKKKPVISAAVAAKANITNQHKRKALCPPTTDEIAECVRWMKRRSSSSPAQKKKRKT